MMRFILLGSLLAFTVSGQTTSALTPAESRQTQYSFQAFAASGLRLAACATDKAAPSVTMHAAVAGPFFPSPHTHTLLISVR